MTLDNRRIRPLPPWTALCRDIEDARLAAGFVLAFALCVLMFEFGYFLALAGALR